MKLYLSLLLLCSTFLSVATSAQPYYDLIQQAHSRHDAKDYSRSLILYEQAFEFSKKVPGDLVSGAGSAAMAGNKEKAFQWLSWAEAAGYSNSSKFEKNPDLVTLHNDKRWLELSAKIMRRSEKIEKNYDIPLQKELLGILPDDQEPRLAYNRLAAKAGDNSHALDSLSTLMIHNDSINGVKIKKLLNENGWIGTAKVGRDAGSVVFLVIQHSQDLQFQIEYLPMIRQAVTKGDASADELALLEDRVAVRQAKRQTYGSQIYFDEKTGKYYVAPLDDPLHVDHRRARMGLQPISEYVGQFDIVWNPQEYAKKLPELDKLSRKW
jgi:hypothetical protein